MWNGTILHLSAKKEKRSKQCSAFTTELEAWRILKPILLVGVLDRRTTFAAELSTRRILMLTLGTLHTTLP